MLMLALLGAVGCQSGQSTSMPNPFLSADRVPAPATRIPPVGAAQPYYPGNALPIAPVGTPQAASRSSEVPSLFDGAHPADAPDVAPALALSEATVRVTGFANPSEGSVRIPGDDNQLRFAISREIVSPEAFPPQETTPVLPASGVNKVAGAATQPVVQPAIYRPYSYMTEDGSTPEGETPEDWVLPSGDRPDGPATFASQRSAGASSGLFRQPAVPGATATAVASSTAVPAPRIRLPDTPLEVQGEFAVQQAHQVLSPAAVSPEMVSPEMVSPGMVSPRVVTAASYAAASEDGFRPRGSTARRESMVTTTSGIPQLRVIPQESLPTDAATGQGQYGYGPQYQWLRGRLEYLPQLGYWKIRYIPINGAVDELGGSVVIQNPEAVASFQPGQFIVAQGELVAVAGQGTSSQAGFTVYTARAQ